MDMETMERSLSVLPLAAVTLVVLMWGAFVWVPDSAGYELILHHPTVMMIVVTLEMTAMLVPLVFSKRKLDRVGGICASFLPVAAALAGILFLEMAEYDAAWPLVWLAAWSIAAAIRHGSRKGWRTFGCVIGGMVALAGLGLALIVSNVPEVRNAMEENVVRSAVSPDGTLIAEEVGHGEEDSIYHIVQVRETDSADALIGTLRRPARALHNPFYGSGTIEALQWTDDDAIALRIKGHDEPVLLEVRHKESE